MSIPQRVQQSKTQAHVAVQRQAAALRRPQPQQPDDTAKVWESVLAIHHAVEKLEVAAAHRTDPAERRDLLRAAATIGTGLNAYWQAFCEEGC